MKDSYNENEISILDRLGVIPSLKAYRDRTGASLMEAKAALYKARAPQSYTQAEQPAAVSNRKLLLAAGECKARLDVAIGSLQWANTCAPQIAEAKIDEAIRAAKVALEQLRIITERIP